MKPTTKIRFTEPQIALVMRAHPNWNLDRLTELCFEFDQAGKTAASSVRLLRSRSAPDSPNARAVSRVLDESPLALSGISFAKTRTPPGHCDSSRGGVLGNPRQVISSETRFLMKGSALQTRGRTKSSSRNVRRSLGITPRADGRLSSITRAPCRKVMGVPGHRWQAAR
jgi:hypothetical protein